MALGTRGTFFKAFLVSGMAFIFFSLVPHSTFAQNLEDDFAPSKKVHRPYPTLYEIPRTQPEEGKQALKGREKSAGKSSETVAGSPQRRTRASLGGFLGMAKPGIQDLPSRLTMGLRGQWMLPAQFSAGLGFQFWQHEKSDASGSQTITLMPLTLEGNYWLDPTSRGLYFGARLGLFFESIVSNSLKADVLSTSASDVEPVLGLQAGYEWEISPKFSVGPQGVMDFIISSQENYSFLSLQFALHYWF